MSSPNLADKSTRDVKSPISLCPARQPDVFIVPARYALSEKPAQHSCFSPAIKTASHPMALRRLRVGYLYLWHAQGPLKRYAVAADGRLQLQGLDAPHSVLASGSDAGISLKKDQDAWLLYTERPIGAEQYQQLDDPQQRSTHMRKIALPRVARELETEHCPPLTQAEKLLAELMPEVREQAMAQDQQKNAAAHKAGIDQLSQQMMDNPSYETIKPYTDAMLWQAQLDEASAQYPDASEHPIGEWSAVPWDVAGTDAWLQQAKSQAADLWPVFAAVDDDLGVLRDLNFEQVSVNLAEEEWEHNNALKGMIAGFINSLINEDGAELSNQFNYIYRERDLELTPEQGETLLQQRHKLEALMDEETQVNRDMRRTLGHSAADARLAEIKQEQEIVMAPVRAFIPADLQNQVQLVIMNYVTTKETNMTDARSGAQVSERVDLVGMQQWISQTAEPHQQWLVDRRSVLLADTEAYLDRHGPTLWYADFDSEDHCTWLSELSLNTLSELCSTGPGTQLAMNLLRAPSVNQPLSMLSSGFSPSLMDLADRAVNVQAALESPTQEAVGKLLGSLVAAGKLTWLSGLGGPNGTDWSQAVSRLSAAFTALQAENLTGAGSSSNLIQRFPPSLRGMLLILRLGSDTVFKAGSLGFHLSGSTGQKLWDWSQYAGKQLQKGLTPVANQIKSLNKFGGLLPLAALLLHVSNVASINKRDQGRENDDVRGLEHAAENFKVGAALSAVIGSAWEDTGQVEISKFGVKSPVITLFGTVVGALATVATIFDLLKLSAEMQKEGAYWTDHHWARLSHDSTVMSLMAAQTGLGGYATYMVITGEWLTEYAVKWFTVRLTPVGWLLLIVEGLYFVWNYFEDSELQTFLEQCCWGNQRRWGNSPEQQSAELQTLVNLLFKPKVIADGHITSRQLGGGGNSIVLGSETDDLQILLPGAEPERTQLYLCLVAVNDRGSATDCTLQWLEKLNSEWMPYHNGMGLSLSGKLPECLNTRYWQVQVLYHSPLALQTGALSTDPEKLVIGGGMGMRYIINGSAVTEHKTNDGPLVIDRFKSQLVNPEKLRPKDAS